MRSMKLWWFSTDVYILEWIVQQLTAVLKHAFSVYWHSHIIWRTLYHRADTGSTLHNNMATDSTETVPQQHDVNGVNKSMSMQSYELLIVYPRSHSIVYPLTPACTHRPLVYPPTLHVPTNPIILLYLESLWCNILQHCQTNRCGFHETSKS